MRIINNKIKILKRLKLKNINLQGLKINIKTYKNLNQKSVNLPIVKMNFQDTNKNTNNK